MLRSRIIPCLLVRNGGLVKTRQFGDDKYVGDPINAIRIFNEKEADELTLLDIDATSAGRPPDMALIGNAADQCRMPLAYGGGVASAAVAEQIIRLGVEKVCVSAAAVQRPQLIREIADRIGSQSVSVVLDVKHRRLQRRSLEVVTHNGNRRTGLDPIEVAAEAQRLGAGSLADVDELIRAVGPVGAAAGSLFVFKGRFRAVLINYQRPASAG